MEKKNTSGSNTVYIISSSARVCVNDIASFFFLIAIEIFFIAHVQELIKEKNCVFEMQISHCHGHVRVPRIDDGCPQ